MKQTRKKESFGLDKLVLSKEKLCRTSPKRTTYSYCRKKE